MLRRLNDYEIITIIRSVTGKPVKRWTRVSGIEDTDPFWMTPDGEAVPCIRRDS